MADPPAARPAPTSARGQRTRAALVAAARAVFERDGYLDARIADISAEARVATGSFYTHFADKRSVLVAVLDELTEQMLAPAVNDPDPPGDPAATIAAANLAYLTAYRDNARLMRLVEEVAAVDAEFRAQRRERTVAFHERTARSIARLQRDGHADPALDPVAASIALSAMVSRTAYGVFGLGDEDIALERMAETVTRLWLNGLRIEDANGG